jgi:hypothetical protein
MAKEKIPHNPEMIPGERGSRLILSWRFAMGLSIYKSGPVGMNLFCSEGLFGGQVCRVNV